MDEDALASVAGEDIPAASHRRADLVRRRAGVGADAISQHFISARAGAGDLNARRPIAREHVTASARRRGHQVPTRAIMKEYSWFALAQVARPRHIRPEVPRQID